MGFRIEYGEKEADEGKLKREQRDVACDCWFTSGGKMIPRFLKYCDEEGIIRQIRDIRVVYTQERRYCGIPAREYRCEAEIGGRLREFILRFWMEECRWQMELCG